MAEIYEEQESCITGSLHIGFRYRVEGRHTRVVVFVGKDREHLQKSGELFVQNEEVSHLVKMFTNGVESDYHLACGPYDGNGFKITASQEDTALILSVFPKVSGPGPCPVCKGETVEKKGKFGKFYGCTKFPVCRGSRDIVE